MKGWNWLFLSLIAVGAFVLASGGSVTPFDPKPTLVAILYEADNGEPPAYAAGAVNKLRKAGRDARMIDDDPATGLNTVPAEIAPAIEPGRKIMGGTDGKGYALVTLSGPRVVKAIALPASEEAILEACQ